MKKSELRQMIREELLTEAKSSPEDLGLDIWYKAQNDITKKAKKAFVNRRVSLDGIGGVVTSVKWGEWDLYTDVPILLTVDWDSGEHDWSSNFVYINQHGLAWEVKKY